LECCNPRSANFRQIWGTRRLGFGEFGDEVGEIFPEEFAAVDDLAAAQVEEVDGDHAVFAVVAEDVGIVVLDGGDALLFGELVDGDEEVAVFRG